MFQKIRAIIASQLNVAKEEVTADLNVKEDLGADSLDLFELAMVLEREFELEIPSEDLEQIVTVHDIMEYLKNKSVEEYE